MDYIAVSRDVVFLPGSTNGSRQCVRIVIYDTDPLESSETFTVTMTTTYSVIMEQNITTITITESNSND